MDTCCYDYITAATIHEAGHVSYSEKQLDVSPYLFPFLNCLEDIRIDNLLFLRYPGVRETYFQTLVVTALEQTREKDSINSKILKSLILKGEGFDKHDYHEPEVTQFFNLNQEKINAILRQTKSASLTSALFPLAEDLAMLFLSD